MHVQAMLTKARTMPDTRRHTVL